MQRASQRGFSLMEMMVIVAIVSVVMLLAYRMIEETVRSSNFAESHNDLAVMSQQAVNALQTELLQTRLVFEEDSLGTAYRAALVLPPEYPVWTTSLLPVIDSESTAVLPDADDERFTGNALLLARQMPPIAVLYDHDNKAGTPKIEFLADRYRFEYAFLTKDTRQSFARSGMAMTLMFSTSADYADYFQLKSAANKGKLVSELIDAGLARAWDPGQPVASAFYALSGAKDGTFDAALKNPKIDMIRTKTLLRGLLWGRVSGRMAYSVAFARKPEFPLSVPVDLYGVPDASRPGFPSGFEVKIVGPAGKRKVGTRVVLMANYGRNYVAQQAAVTTAARF